MRPLALLFALCPLLMLAAAVPARAQSGSGSPSQSAQRALDTELRLNAVESQMRDLTGRIEKLTNDFNKLKAQLDRLSNDVDMRFNQLQHPAPGSMAAASPAPGGAQPAPPHGAGDMSQPPTRSGTLGTVAAPKGAAPPAAGQQTAAAPGAVAKGSPQDQYNYAMGLLTQANYAGAEEAMRSFLQRWPKDPLAGNAQYWLGETFYVRKDYASAATIFAQGYEKYPKGAKAPADLLKLGMSLANLDKKADACRAYAHLERDFPTASRAIKDRLAIEKKRAGC